jgi:hypothetical protein
LTTGDEKKRWASRSASAPALARPHRARLSAAQRLAPAQHRADSIATTMELKRRAELHTHETRSAYSIRTEYLIDHRARRCNRPDQ